MIDPAITRAVGYFFQPVGSNAIFLPGLWNDNDVLSHQGTHISQDPERGQIIFVGSCIPKAHEGLNGCGGSVKDGYLVRLKHVYSNIYLTH
jgi:hypothetical protein